MEPLPTGNVVFANQTAPFLPRILKDARTMDIIALLSYLAGRIKIVKIVVGHGVFHEASLANPAAEGK